MTWGDTHVSEIATKSRCRPDWPDGSIIYTGRGEPDLRVIGYVDPDAAEMFDALMAEPV